MLTNERSDYKEFITLLVGPESSPTTFIVHKEAATARSKFISAACSSNWIEGQSKTIKLPEEKPDYIQAYIHWLYTNSVNLAILGQCISPRKWEEHIKLYLLANRLDDIRLRNMIINMIVDIDTDVSGKLPSYKSVTLAYDGTHDGAPLRKLLVSLFFARLSRDEITNVVNHVPKAFLEDLICKTFVLLPATTWERFKEGRAEYQEG